MEDISTFAKFVSQKITKVRWKPKGSHLINKTTEFATGSWDDEVNKVCLWTLETNQSEEAEPWSRDGVKIDVEPRLLCEVPHSGDVTELAFLQNNHILASSSSGTLQLYKHHSNSQTLSVAHSWPSLHAYRSGAACACVALAVRAQDAVVTAGEDGRLCFLSLEHRQPTRVIEKADSCTITALTSVKQAEVAAVNSTGQLKVWDVRQGSDQPARIFLPTGERSGLHCVDKHPSQPHIVVTGGHDGALTVWDMRQDRFPVNVLSAHSASMWEVRFHPSNPDSVFSCSEDGSVWHWDASQGGEAALKHIDVSHLAGAGGIGLGGSGDRPNMPPQNPTSAGSVWLGSEASKHRMDVTDLLPGNQMSVNSLDVLGDTLLCGTDGEQIYTLCNLVVR